MTLKKINTACIYARSPLGDEAAHASNIARQIDIARNWCAANGVDVVTVYQEPGASVDRVVFARMMDNVIAHAHPYDAVIVHSLSRFGRDPLRVALADMRLGNAGVELICVERNPHTGQIQAALRSSAPLPGLLADMPGLIEADMD